MPKTTQFWIPLACAFLILLLTQWLTLPALRPPLKVSKQMTEVNFDSKFLKLISLGQHRLLADWLWIQTLMESDLAHHKGHDLNNWLYLRFDTITNLDPKFLNCYTFGGQYLAVVKNDVLGAKKFLEKGLSAFPENFILNFTLAIHFMTSLNDNQGAIKHLARIIGHPQAPRYLPSLVAKLVASEGDLHWAYQLMRDLWQRTPPSSRLKAHYYQKLYALKAEIDLNCLNHKTPNSTCPRSDLDGHPYLIDPNGVYSASKKWNPVRAHQHYRNKQKSKQHKRNSGH